MPRRKRKPLRNGRRKTSVNLFMCACGVKRKKRYKVSRYLREARIIPRGKRRKKRRK